MAETEVTERPCFRLLGEPGEPILPLSSSLQLIGRTSQAAIPLASADVHHKHAALVRYDASGWIVHGLNATKRLLLNDQPVQRALLKNGDRLTVGPHVLQFDGVTQESSGSRNGRLEAAAPACELAIEASDEPPRVVLLEEDCLIGSAERADLRLTCQGISTLHCVVVREGGDWHIHDLKSEHGVFLNSTPVSSSRLSDRDRIQLGSCRLVVRFAADPIPAELLAKADAAARMLAQGEFAHAVQAYRQVCAALPFHIGFRKALRAAQQRWRGHCDTPTTFSGRWKSRYFGWRARRAVASGRWNSALERLETGLSVDPWNRDLLMLEALVFEKNELYELCLWSLEQGRSRNPNDPRVNRPLARLQHYLGALDEATNSWRRVAVGDPDDPEPQRQLRSIQVERTLRHGRYFGLDSTYESSDQSD